MRKKKKNKHHQPYAPIKMKFFEVSHPLGDVPREARQAIVREAGVKARASFEVEYPKLAEWFDRYDPLSVLSFCTFYFLTTPQGVDPEAIEGKLDFGSHHLELLQAIALIRPAAGGPRPLSTEGEHVRQAVKNVGDYLHLMELDLPADMPETEVRKRMVLAQMRGQTFAVRNWAYPEHALDHLRSLFGGQLSEIVASVFPGISIVRAIDMLKVIAQQIEDRLNAHIAILRRVVTAPDSDAAYTAYREGFPDIVDDHGGIRKAYEDLFTHNLMQIKGALVAHADLRLNDIYTVSLDDAVRAYGGDVSRDCLLALLKAWSYEFGDIGSQNPKHLIYTNPVLQRPFIRVADESFFWALSGIYAHTLPGMIEGIIPAAHRERYVAIRSKYLEDYTEDLLRKSFPNGKVYRGSQWRPPESPTTIYENDVLVVVDSTALVVECKAHLVDPPARRGAEFRLADTLEDLVVESSRQASRFAEFLKAHPQKHRFSTLNGSVNTVDSSRLLRFIPIAVTYENLGLVSANLKELVEAGLVASDQPLVPSICLTDLQVITEILDSQAERIHYLARRAEIEQTMHYRGDELDLLALYTDTGFNIGEVQSGSHFMELCMMSKELDPYFVARFDGVTVPKPHLKLTDWWRRILAQIERRQNEFWTEIAYVFLSVTFDDQNKFESDFKQLANKVRRDRTGHRHDWVVMLSGTQAPQQYGVIGFPYRDLSREERNRIVGHIVGEFGEQSRVHGTVVVSVDVRRPADPYDMLAFVPGKAAGAVNFRGMTFKQPFRPGSEATFHLKSPPAKL